MKTEREPRPPYLDFPSVNLPPNVRVHFLFGKHQTSADFGSLSRRKAQIKAADIFIIESVGSGDGARRRLNKISRGDYQLFTKTKEAAILQGGSDFQLAELDAIYNSGTYIDVVDIDGDDNRWLRGEMDNQISLMGMAVQNPNFSSATDEFFAACVMYAKLSTQRSKIMLNNLEKRIKLRFDENPKLADKESVDILMQLGSAHSDIYQSLKEEYPDRITLEVLPQHITPNYFTQFSLMWSYGLFQKLTPNEQTQLIQKVVINEIMNHYARGMGIDVHMGKQRAFIDALSPEDLVHIHKTFSMGTFSSDDTMNRFLIECKFVPGEGKVFRPLSS